MDLKIGLTALAGLALAVSPALVSPALVSPALAQTTPTPAPGTKQVIPEKKGEPIQNGRSESLSKKLSKTGGVISPGGNVDPGMKAPAPNASEHTMPVIPPSATGGDTAK